MLAGDKHQQLVSQKIRNQLGDLMIANVDLSCALQVEREKVAALEAEIKKLKEQKEKNDVD